MSFSETEKADILSMWGKVSDDADEIGAETLERMFGTFPETEKDVRGIMAQLQLADLHSYGGKLVNAVGNIAKQMDHIDQDLPELHDLLELTRDPSNFRLLSQALQVVLAANYPADFTPTTQDKFLTAVATVLAVKYK